MKNITRATLLVLLTSMYACKSDSDPAVTNTATGGTESTATGGTESTATGGTESTATGGTESTATGGTTAEASSCESLCGKSDELACAGDTPGTCLEQCQSITDSEVCNAEFQAALKCMGTVPLSDWVCDKDGEADIGPGLCVAENAAVETCVANLSE